MESSFAKMISPLKDKMENFKIQKLKKRRYICSHCEKMKFDPRLFSCTYALFFPLRLSYVKEMKPNCAMCHALKSIDGYPFAFGSSHVYQVPSIMTQFEVDWSIFGEEDTLKELERLTSTKWLMLSNPMSSAHKYGGGFLAEFTEESTDIPGPRVNHINPKEIAYDKIRGWMEACMRQHSGVCTKEPIFMHHLDLIDCHTRLIVDWKPGSRYSALSYVWGAPNHGSGVQDGNKLPDSLPQTIEDAITVTTQLNIPYLWVDRYCIRDSGVHKAEQIRNMHNIYQGAEITIIALAGADPFHGLPGVHPNLPRRDQVKVFFKGHEVLSTGRGLRFHIDNSEWAHRGWTLQEGLLSRRRLLFTDEQVFFECDKFHCCESIDLLPLDRLEQILSSPRIKSKEPELSLYYSSNHKPEQIYRIIGDYMNCQLSHDEDILDAMRGILAYFEDQYPRTVRHIWGLPIFLDAGMNSIAWYLSSALLWEQTMPCRRRDGFPSWSWTGWKGCKSMIIVRSYCRESLEIRIQLGDGTFISSIHDFADLLQYRQISQSISRFLVIKANTVDIQIYTQDHGYDNVNSLRYPQGGNIFEAVLLPLDERQKRFHGKFLHNELIHAESALYKKFSSSSTWQGIIFHHSGYMANEIIIFVMHRVKDWWERLGTVRFAENDKKPLRLDDYSRGLREIRLR